MDQRARQTCVRPARPAIIVAFRARGVSRRRSGGTSFSQQVPHCLELPDGLCESAGEERVQELVNGARWILESRALLLYCQRNGRRMQIKLVADELIGMLGKDAEGLQCTLGKIPQVVRDDYLRLTNDCCRKNVTVLWIWKREPFDQWLIVLDEAISDSFVHSGSRIGECILQLGACFQQRANPFVVNRVSPSAVKKPRLRDAQQDIAQRGWI